MKSKLNDGHIERRTFIRKINLDFCALSFKIASNQVGISQLVLKSRRLLNILWNFKLNFKKHSQDRNLVPAVTS